MPARSESHASRRPRASHPLGPSVVFTRSVIASAPTKLARRAVSPFSSSAPAANTFVVPTLRHGTVGGALAGRGGGGSSALTSAGAQRARGGRPGQHERWSLGNGEALGCGGLGEGTAWHLCSALDWVGVGGSVGGRPACRRPAAIARGARPRALPRRSAIGSASAGSPARARPQPPARPRPRSRSRT